MDGLGRIQEPWASGRSARGKIIGFNSDQYDISDWQVVSDIYGCVYRVSSVFAGADLEGFPSSWLALWS